MDMLQLDMTKMLPSSDATQHGQLQQAVAEANRGTHRHVAGEVDGAEGVDVVVHIAGVAAALAAVLAGPLWRGSLEPDAQTVAAGSDIQMLTVTQSSTTWS